MTPADGSASPSWHDRRLSRRRFLAGTAAAVSAGALVGRLPSVSHAAEGGSGLHGVELRGMYLTSKNRLAEGRFGTMFKQVPAFAPPDELLTSLARTMVEDQTVPDGNHLNTSPVLFAGFTFIGQFIDHDITLDTTPLNLQLADPDATVNFRTARYDLDSVYRGGPVNDPAFYDPADRDKLLLRPNVNGVLDVPRDGNGRAIIGDPRNDENLIIVQFHKAVIQFHNKLVDYLRSQGMRPEWVFEGARRLARWHYQWAVIHDFLPRFVGDQLVGPAGTVYKEVAGKPPVLNVRYYKPTNKDGRPFMPVEFAVAAYRFAHSIIRPFYVVNQTSLDRGGVPIFGPDGGSTSTVGARSRPTWSWCGTTSFASNRARVARHARSTRTCRCRLPSSPGPRSRLLTRQKTWPYATPSAENGSVCRPGSRPQGQCAPPCCPTPRSGSAMIRAGRARHRCGSTF